MDTLREVYLSIGKGSYEEDLERVKALVRQAGPHPGNCAHVPFRGMDQETLLLLTCLQLAYSLDSVTAKLEELSKRLGILPEEPEETEEPEGPEETEQTEELEEPETNFLTED